MGKEPNLNLILALRSIEESVKHLRKKGFSEAYAGIYIKNA
jgi:hypothetical protein